MSPQSSRSSSEGERRKNGSVCKGTGTYNNLHRFTGVTRTNETRQANRAHVDVGTGLAGRRKTVPITTMRAPASDSGSDSSCPRTGMIDRIGGNGRQSGRDKKRFSHDSGLSDSSYGRRKQLQRSVRCDYKRIEPANNEDAHAATSVAALRAFRAELQRTLRNQQEQITRVTQFCEQQAGRTARRHEPLVERQSAATYRFNRRNVDQPSTVESSELSSSTCSSCNQHKNKLRSSECKTYKIIMSKLDELNHLFAMRSRCPPQPHRHRDSSGSVTVSDKLVATDFPSQQSSRLVQCGVCERDKCTGDAPGGKGTRHEVSCALALKVPPRPQSNVVTARLEHRRPITTAGTAMISTHYESDWGSDSSGRSDVTRTLSQRFDLEDPMHFYAQSKRLRAFHARTPTQQATGTDETPRRLPSSASRGSKRDFSVCALCRGYWRHAYRCLIAPIYAMKEYIR